MAQVLAEAITAGVCSAAAVACGEGERARTWYAGTTRSWPTPGPAIGPATPFDLASLTKPMATTLVAMRLLTAGRLDLGALAARWLPALPSTITIAHLMGHASGLPCHRPFYERLWAGDLGGSPDARTALVALAASAPLDARPGTVAVYSDLGYVTLGAVLERAGDAPLEDQTAAAHRDLGLDATTFVDLRHARASGPGATTATAVSTRGPDPGATTASAVSTRGPGLDAPSAIDVPRMQRANPAATAGHAFAAPPVATEHDQRRGLVAGEVHDENCHAGGGIAGHAGLFAPLADVARFAAIMADAPRRGAPGVSAAVVARCFTTSAAPRTSWRLGWDTPSSVPGVSHAGDAWPRAAAVGHLGFTGTSIWLDWARGRWLVLLSNRVHPDRLRPAAAGIKPLRRAVGDLACALLAHGR